MVEKTIRLGTNRGQPRLWLEGKTLSESGFKRGDKFTALRLEREGRPTTLSVAVWLGDAAEKTRTVSGKTTPKGDHPIIDINGAILSPFVGKSLKLTGDNGIITLMVEE